MPEQKEYVMDVVFIDMEAARERVLKMLTRDRKSVEMRMAPPAQVEVTGSGRVPQEFLDHLMQSVGFRHADRVKVTPPTRTEALLASVGIVATREQAEVLGMALEAMGRHAKARLTAGIVGDVMDLIDARTPRKDSAWLDGANVKGLMRGLKRDIVDASGL
jgi:hypothetical protein